MKAQNCECIEEEEEDDCLECEWIGELCDDCFIIHWNEVKGVKEE